MSVPVVGFPPRLMLSALAGAGRFCVLGSAAARWKGVRARNRRGLSDLHPQLLPKQNFRDSPSWLPRNRSEPRTYITSPELATTLVQILQRENRKPHQLFLECNPGPGILTQALLESQAKVVALECNRTFLPHLESLQKVNRKLQVVHCDFFKLDPRNFGIVKPPIMLSETLFQNLGIEALPWSQDNPIRVVGIFPAKNEKKILWKLLYDLYSSTSIYSYGRVELNMFIAEKEYEKLVADPQNKQLYQPLSVLWQVACKIKLLHVEPWSSFSVYSQGRGPKKLKNKESLEQINKEIGQNMCFIRLTPLRNLFTENLTSINYDVFFHMLKQCFMKRHATLRDHLQSLSPVNAVAILKKIEKNGDAKITDLYPRDFKLLFETIECSRESCRWLFDDSIEDIIL